MGKRPYFINIAKLRKNEGKTIGTHFFFCRVLSKFAAQWQSYYK